MPKICYTKVNFRGPTLSIIAHAARIITDWQNQGYDLTLRQVYYQMIAGDFFPDEWVDEEYNRRHGLDLTTKNTIKNYKKFGGVLSDARRAGLIDWHAIVDRKRNLQTYSHWNSPADIIRSAANGYAIDKWVDQPYRVEVWVEKDALIGVLERAASVYGLPHFSCSGYSSDSEMWRAAQRFRQWGKGGQTPLVILLTDHDPSGKDMERDITDRLYLFSGGHNIDIRRIALTMDQVEEFSPPPNPAKETDARYAKYAEEFGDQSWELDAMTPAYINEIITGAVEDVLDHDAWTAATDEEEDQRIQLTAVSNKWARVVDIVDTL